MARTAVPTAERRDATPEPAVDRGGPLATIAIAAYNCEEYLEQAVASALVQDVSVEVIIVDDVSSDDTAELAESLARKDARIRVVRRSQNGGPAGARNDALAAARGRWFAILDADDLLHPNRLRMLIDTAEAEGADLIADDLIVFDETNRTRPARFLKNSAAGSREWITLESYLRRTKMLSRAPNLGFLKPVIRLDALRATGLRYDERLRIGEDDLFVLQMLRAGLRYRLLAVPGYYYRKHSASISHRLSQSTIDQIAVLTMEMGTALSGASASERRAHAARERSVRRALSFVHLVDHLKARDWGKAIREIAATPSVITLLHRPLTDRLARWVAGRSKQTGSAGNILVIAPESGKAAARAIASRATKAGHEPKCLHIETQSTNKAAGHACGTSETISASQLDGTGGARQLAEARLRLLDLGRRAEQILVIGNIPAAVTDALARPLLAITRISTEDVLPASDRTVPALPSDLLTQTTG